MKGDGARKEYVTSLKKEYEIIELLSKKYSINSLCKLMGINRSGYYKWIKRKDTIMLFYE